MNKKNKVLIIGAKGMLGQALLDVFKKDKSYAITAWDREDIDVTDEKEVKEKVSDLKPNIIINATAYNAVDKCEEDKAEYELAKKLNGKAPEYLAKISKKLEATFITYSTDYVFDGEPDIPEPDGCTHSCATCSLHQNFVPQIGFREDDMPNPISKYGKSKVMGEKAVAKVGGSYYIIRLSKLFGKAGASEISKQSFFDTMQELAKTKKKLRVIDEETSCFTYAPDLAQKTKEIIEAQKPFGIYHITNEDSCTWYDAACELFHQLKIKIEIDSIGSEDMPRSAKRPFFSVLINTKTNPLRSYRDALKEYLQDKK